MAINGGTIPRNTAAGDLVDNITTEATATETIEVADRVQNHIADNTVGVILATSTTGYNPTGAVADFFSAAAGTESTIDVTPGTGNTDAVYYSTPQYYQSTPTNTVTNGSGATSIGNATSYHGVRVTAQQNCNLIQVKKTASNTGTHAYICTDAGSIQATWAFSGLYATGSFAMTSGTSYRIWLGSGGASYAIGDGTGSPSFPYTSDSLNIIGRAWQDANSTDTNNTYAVDTLTTDYGAGDWEKMTIKTAQLTDLDGSASYVRLRPYNSTLDTGTALTFDLDYDHDGTYELEGAAVDTWVSLGGEQTLDGAILRINLEQGTGSSSDRVTLQGYCLMVD